MCVFVRAYVWAQECYDVRMEVEDNLQEMFSPSTMWVPASNSSSRSVASTVALWASSQTPNVQFHIYIYKFSNV